jgi:hypothetical protein
MQSLLSGALLNYATRLHGDNTSKSSSLRCAHLGQHHEVAFQFKEVMHHLASVLFRVIAPEALSQCRGG